MIKMYDLVGEDKQRRFSPYCWRIKMALAHKGLDAEFIPWHFTEKQALEFSGQGSVPVLVDGDQVISDSWDIAQYLEKTYSDKPSLKLDSGEVLFIKYWAESVLHAEVMKMLCKNIHDHLSQEDQVYFRESREKRFGVSLEEFSKNPEERLTGFQKALTPLKLTLKKQNYIAGDSAGFSDYIVFGAFQWARSISPLNLLDKENPIYAWRERMLDLHESLGRNTLAYPV